MKFVFPLMLCVLFLTACPKNEESCDTNSDCSATQECQDGTCRETAECTGDPDCTGGYTCVENKCVDLDAADKMIENVVGIFSLPMGVALNFLINGRDYVVPLAVEEPSIVAGLSGAAPPDPPLFETVMAKAEGALERAARSGNTIQSVP